MDTVDQNVKKYTEYCLNCKTKPCQKGCPLGNDIPRFIQLMKEDKWEEAYESLCETTVLGEICGRICPHEKQCQGSCVRGMKGEPVSIGFLEATCFDKNRGKAIPIIDNALLGKKIAVLGGGPARINL